MIVICPVCGTSLSVEPKIKHVTVNQQHSSIYNNLSIEWGGSVVYHHCGQEE